MKVSKLLTIATLLLLLPLSAFAATEPPEHIRHNKFHPMVTNQGVLLYWYDTIANQPTKENVPPGSYEVKDENGNVRGWITQPTGGGAPYWTPKT